MNTYDFANRTAIVTGGGQGIGHTYRRQAYPGQWRLGLDLGH